jgi:hypothetical protein
MVTPAAMVFGVLLAPGERVLYYHREEPGWQKPLLIIVGLIMSLGIIGLFILYAGLTATTQVFVVTNRRFMIIEGRKGKSISFIWHGQVKRVTRHMKNSVLKFIDLTDGLTTLSYQVAANPPHMPQTVLGFLENPSSLEHAPSVQHENLIPAK